MESLSDEIESILFVGQQVLAKQPTVYRLPPRTSNEGYKAADWNSSGGMLWKGGIRVVERGRACEIRLEDANTGELFAMCNYSPDNNSVEPVLDSSRYFVLRVEGDGGKKAYIGMGFEERGDAFDFNVALQSYSKHLSNPTGSSNENDALPTKPPAPVQDFSLKEGQTFSVKIPGRGARRSEAAGGGGSGTAEGSGQGAPSVLPGTGSGGIPLLAPPPGKKR